SPHCWISTLTSTFGYLALKSALTLSMTCVGALPFISQTVKVPVWSAGLLLVPVLPSHAVATRATATETTPNHPFRNFIQAISPCWLNSARVRRRGGRLDFVARPPWSSRAERRPSARCGFAAERGRRPGDNGRRDRWSGRTRRSDLTRRRSSARREM